MNGRRRFRVLGCESLGEYDMQFALEGIDRSETVEGKAPKITLPKPKSEPNLRSSYVFEAVRPRQEDEKKESPAISLSPLK